MSESRFARHRKIAAEYAHDTMVDALAPHVDLRGELDLRTAGQDAEVARFKLLALGLTDHDTGDAFVQALETIREMRASGSGDSNGPY